MFSSTASSKPRLLISNDDGITAPGMQALTKALAALDAYDVRVGAPDSERSGSSHAVSGKVGITNCLDVAQIGLPSSIRAFSTSGYPADAVRLPFIYNIFGDEWKPDLVVSGINRGANVGRHVVISGTVGAASDACLRDTKGLAVSIHLLNGGGRAEEDYALAARLICPVIEWFEQEVNWPTSVLLNMNIPFKGKAPDDASIPAELLPKGLVVVPQGKSYLESKGELIENMNGSETQKHEQYIKFRWNPRLDPQGSISTDDVLAVHTGYMTLTPLPVYQSGDDLQKAMELLQGWKLKHHHPLVAWTFASS